MKKKKLLIPVLLIAIVMVVGFAFHFANKSSIELKVKNYYALNEYYFDGDFEEFAIDTFNWYKKIENNSGVYLINTYYYDDSILEIWRENKTFNAIPNNEFWQFTASVSYVNTMGIDIDKEVIENAKSGTRVYLIPSTLDDDEMLLIKAHLEEVDSKIYDDNLIETAFTNNPTLSFVTYTPNEEHFTWPSEKGQPLTESAPIIFICTTENMRYFESESLYATGLYNYIKFDDKSTFENLKDDNLDKYNMQFIPSNEIYLIGADKGYIEKGIDQVFE